MKLCKLSPELHEKRLKKSVLILVRKTRCFLKKYRFWTFFQLPVGSSTVCKDFASKTVCFLHFCNFPVESSSKHVILEWKLPGPDTQKMTKYPTCWIKKCWSSQLTWKTKRYSESEAPRLLPQKRRSNAWNSVFCCFDAWELSIQMAKKCCLDEGSTEK